MNKFFNENIGITAIIVFFSIFFYFNTNSEADLWWDSSVYIGMGKYIYSFGEYGLYESSRPLVWPLILGFFWKIGLDAILFGKILVFLFSIGTIMAAYFIACELFGKKVALLASFLLAFSPTFFFFGSIMFTEIPSTFFAFLGIYYFVKGKYSLAGLIFGISFMTRFFQIFLIFPVYLFFVYLVHRKKATRKQFLISLLFFLVPVLPFLALNMMFYNNAFYPFFLQAWMTKFTGWAYHEGFSFYFAILVNENILILFFILGAFFLFKDGQYKNLMVPFVFLVAFLPFNFAAHKEARFLIFLLPMVYMITSFGIVSFLGFCKKYRAIALFLILTIGIVSVAPQLKLNNYDDKLDSFYSFMENRDIKGGLWISNPSFIAYSDAKASELVYYPLYNIEKIKKLKERISRAEYIMLNSCDIMPCPPYEGACDMEHEQFIKLLSRNFKTVLKEEHDNCEHYIFIS